MRGNKEKRRKVGLLGDNQSEETRIGQKRDERRRDKM